MSFLNENYHIGDSEFGYKRIRVTGRCTRDEVFAIKEDVVTRWKWAPIPNTTGAIFKALDGSNPYPVEVVPDTTGEFFECVKIAAHVEPFAAEQGAGPYDGETILFFEIIYQQVGNIA